jgi:SET domain-containing protein
MALLEKELEVKTSTISGGGNGLFTKVFIPKGSRIIEYKGTITTWEKVKNEADNPYIYFVKSNHVIDARHHPKSLGRYANDAKGLVRKKDKSNNALFEADGLRVFMIATKDIHPGEEIFIQYGRDYWNTVRRNMEIDKAAKK